MRQSSRSIVVKDGNILLMKRFKMGQEYYTLPGGGVKPNEPYEQAALRETIEETSLVVNNPRLVFVEDAGSPFGMQNIYLCDYASGEPHLPADSEEMFWSVEGKNTYEPLWFPFANLQDIPFVSPLLRQALCRARDSGWPEEPFHFSSVHAQRLS
jgi:ADP-ribose pyrophosphatase YjhB (NUDIX family)